MANRVHVRSGSAGPDNRAFREAIANMRLEVLETKAETQRVRDQLNCLIMLVKRAWMGDQAAAIHVANIVGAAPPKFFRDEETEEVNAVSKTRVLHHWALLSIGLLSRHFQQLETQALSRAKQRLQQRQDFLDQELAKHRELLKAASGRGLATVKRRGNPYLEQGQKPHNTWNSRPKSSKPGHLAQPESDHSKQYRPTAKELAAPTSMMQHLANVAQAEREQDLFSASHVVPDRSKAQRPSSGKQKLLDSRRARPKSAVVATTKGERPLKYETTRPVSGKPSASSSKARAKSAKASSNRIFEMTEGDLSSSKPHHLSDEHSARNGEDLSLFDEDERPPVRTNGGHARYEDTVSEGLRQMESMEEDFRKTAKMLQEKLGISGDGVI